MAENYYTFHSARNASIGFSLVAWRAGIRPKAIPINTANENPYSMIITVNPDLFSDVIVPLCGFHNDCDVIVTSWGE